MGLQGMKYSLPSRELIADSIEIMLKAHPVDGAVFMAACDKNGPGMLMASARVNIPSIFLSAGPMYSGKFKGKNVDIISVFEALGEFKAGKLKLSELEELERTACPGAGSCAGLFTANSIACMIEALGMSLPGCATAHAEDRKKYQLAEQSGKRILGLVKEGVRPSDIMTISAFENAIRVDMAIGGSTNTTLHLPAIANELGIRIDLEVFDYISRRTPNLTMIRPSGKHTMLDFDRAGGIPAVLKRLQEQLNIDCLTVTGKNIGENLKNVNVKGDDVIKTTKKLIDEKIPIFGICLGLQIIALACGAKTYKLKFGHRGANQPVLDVKTKKVYITSQNHGFAADADSCRSAGITVTHINLNDKSVEGIKNKGPAMAVQYHPEANPGPWDNYYLFDEFIKLLK